MKINTVLMCVIWAVVITLGIVDEHFREIRGNYVYMFSLSVAFIILIYSWFVFDARTIHYTPSGKLKLVVLMFLIIAVPYCLIPPYGFVIPYLISSSIMASFYFKPSYELNLIFVLLLLMAVCFFFVKYKGFRRSVGSFIIFIGWLLLYLSVITITNVVIKYV
ncbi:hypothetical protein [Photobacterium nomapromontoriensis]|uniref:hypothetical protein n=1 Tax=Photobacterium nomapromontoriensis TaxID=2910237 RepID=UPI003D0A15B4